MSTDACVKGLCVVVPCFNEEESLTPFRDVMKQVEPTLSHWLNIPITYVFVNDGSTDHTQDILKRMHEENPNVHYVTFSRNFGKEAALLAGLNKALETKCSYITVMDADLQDPPTLLPSMFERMIDTDCDIVATFRESRDGEPPVRSWFAHRFYHLLNRISSVEMRDGARDFRLMQQRVVKSITSMPERERFSKGLFQWVGFQTEWIGYANIEREHGKTHWSFRSLFKYAIDGIIAFSTLPLEAISVAGLVLCLIALVALLFIIIRTLVFGDPTSGWPSLVCIIIVLSGLQLFGIGILGLYISKIYSEVKRRPLYIISEEV